MKNIGIDIVEKKRFAKMIENEKKVNRILSDFEVKIYNEITNQNRKIEYLASRFCAKEAIIKAINQENLSYSYKDLSILNNENGSPYVKFHFDVNFEVLISLSHSENNCVCVAVMK